MTTPRWFVVQAEERTLAGLTDVATDLHSLGLETLVAVEWRRVRGPKRTHVWRAFPAYGPFLFVRFDRDAHSLPGILATPGVHAVMVSAGSTRPHPVPEAMMREVIAVQAEQDAKARAPEKPPQRRRPAWKPMADALAAFTIA